MQSDQLPFGFESTSSMDESDYLVTASNRDAHVMVRSWPKWPHHMLAIIGAQGSGKTHLASIWAKNSGAVAVFPGQEKEHSLPRRTCFVVDNAQSFVSSEGGETTLFHLFNWTKETGGNVLLTSKIEPNRWNVLLPDLRSRLATVPTIPLLPPDDVLMHVILAKLFADRQLRVDIDVISYILPRIEREYAALAQFVKRLDHISLVNRRKITKPLARQLLAGDYAD